MNEDKKKYCKNELINHTYSNFNFNDLPKKLINASFDDINPVFNEIKSNLLNWDYYNPCICSFLSNKNGIGKSYLSVCLYKKFIFDFISSYINKADIDEFQLEEILFRINNGANHIFPLPKVLYVPERLILLKIRQSYDNHSESELDILSYYCNLDLLVIDDMFATSYNDFSSSMMYSILDERSEWKAKPTIINSNFTSEQIFKINSRIESRINNNFMFEFVSDKFKDLRK